MFSARTVMGTLAPARTTAGISSVSRTIGLLDRVEAAELLLDRRERAEDERLVVRGSAPENSDERHRRAAAGENWRSAVAAADDRRTPGIADEALAKEVHLRAGDARVDAAPRHRATRPAGGPSHLVDRCVQVVRRGVVLLRDREHRRRARHRQAAVVHAGGLGDLASV